MPIESNQRKAELKREEELIDQIIEATKRDQERALHMIEEAIKYASDKDLVN